MKNIAQALFLFISLVLITGCASTQSMVGTGADRSSAKMFHFTPEQADKILSTAMAGEFSGSPISRVEFPNKGYQSTIRFLLDSHTITAYMISAKGRTKDGSIVDGFYYEVNDVGTMTISGRKRAKRLYKRLILDASAVSEPIPMVAGI